MSDKRHRFPSGLIVHAVWLYLHFPHRCRWGAETLHMCASIVWYAMICRWSLKLGVGLTCVLRCGRIKRRNVWQLDEVLQKTAGYQCCTMSVNALIGGACPKCMVTNIFGSYGADRRVLRSTVERVSYKGMNNRAENIYLPLRQSAWIMQNFRSRRGYQRFLVAFSIMRNFLFSPPPMITRSPGICHVRSFAQWGTMATLVA